MSAFGLIKNAPWAELPLKGVVDLSDRDNIYFAHGS